MRPSFRSSASLAERFARSKSEEDRTKFFMRLNAAEIAALQYDWKFWGRPSQQTPPGDWSVWLVLAGRGAGKTRTGSEFVRDEVMSGRAGRIALVAETAADARDVMVEGPSGILAVHPPKDRPTYEPSKRRVTWPNGAVATLYNAVEPDQLRGPQFDLGYCFIAGTMVRGLNRDEPIEKVKPGSLVRVRHGFRRVSTTASRIAAVGAVGFSDASGLVGTTEHPVFTRSGPVPLGNLRFGDTVIALGGPLQVIAPWEPAGEQRVYNLQVEDTPEYFANGILVHNCDELAKWRYAQETWDQLQFGLRLGMHPRCIITTTPRPKPIIRTLVEEAKTGRVFLTRGRMDDNRSNLAPAFVETIRAKYGGTRLGRQELDAEILEDVVGAYWTRGMFERDGFRVNVLPMMRRVVVAVDPSGAGDRDNDLADEIGIVVAGLGVDKRFYVLADLSLRAGPNTWARTAADAYEDYKADRLIAERNFGGAMVEETIRRVAPNVSYKEITSSRSKQIRAEPIAALYEQGRVSHYRDPNGGDLSLLEDQLVCMTDDGYTGPGSPDRLDAAVFALAELSDRTPIQVAKAAVSNALNPAAWGRMPVIDFTRRGVQR